MSVNQNQQINVFNKGMNTDTSDAYLSNEQYRYAENLRFITDTGENSGELRLIEGWKEVYKGVLNKNDIVIAATSVRNLVVLLVNTPTDAIDVGRIIVIDTKTQNYKVIGAFPGNPWKTNIKYSLVTRWESEKNIKLYIADGEHELMTVNLAADANSYNKIEQLCDCVALPTINAHRYKIINEDGVIEYPPGNIRSPKVQYYYYLYTPNTFQSDLSFGSQVQTIYKDDGNGGYYYNESTGLAFELRIGGLQNLNYERIRIYRLEYNIVGEPAQVFLICDEEYKSKIKYGYYSYIDKGSYIQTESVAEFLSNIKYRVAPKLIESKEDVLFAANTKDLQQEVDDLFKNFKFDAQNDLELISKKYTISQFGILKSNNYGPTLMRGETYRYGIVFYLNDGRKSSVFHLCDYTVPENIEFVDIVDYPNYEFTRFGLKFHIRGTLPEECIGYEIVRCERTINDSRTLFQGLIGATFGRKGKNLRYASNLMTLHNIYKFGDYYRKSEDDSSWEWETGQDEWINSSFSDITTFASPEVVYQMDDVKNIIEQCENDLYIHHAQDYGIKGSQYPPSVQNLNRYAIHNDYHEEQIGVIRRSNSSDPWKLYIDDLNIKNSYTTISWADNDIQYRGLFLRPYSKISNLFTDGKSSKILSSEPVYSPDPYKFNDQDNIIIDRDLTAIGNKQYVNWDAHMFFRTGEINVTDPISLSGFGDLKYTLKNYKTLPLNSNVIDISTGKKALLLNTSDLDLYDIPANANLSKTVSISAAINIVNICRHNVVPYGGDSESAKSSNVYYSHGDYVGRTQGYVEVWTGDTYASMFVYNSAHVYCSDRYYGMSIPTVYSVPVESRIDLQARYGKLYPDMISYEIRENNEDDSEVYSNSNGNFGGNNPNLIENWSKNRLAWMFQDKAGVYYGLTQDKDAYMYNTIYSDNTATVSYVERYLENLTEPGTDTRVHHSQPKINGELIDSWTKFKAMDFLDVDSRYGEITGLRLFKNTLIYWQNNATGVLSVNERTILQDTNDSNIILGNGETLQRFDHLSLKYGMKNDQLCDVQSDNALYWWDEDNKDLIMYSGGQSVQPMKIAKTVSNLINTGPIQNPALAYDNKYKEVIFSTVNGKSLAYNEAIQQFTSMYNTQFDHSVEVGDKLLLINKSTINKWNESCELTPILKYIVNDKSTFTKVYDNVQLGMGESFYYREFYNSEDPKDIEAGKTDNKNTQPLTFTFDTIEQHSQISKNITNREYDLRFAIPRNADSTASYANNWGERMRGRTMQCELTSSSSSTGFSIQYIITKYRISWS